MHLGSPPIACINSHVFKQMVPVRAQELKKKELEDMAKVMAELGIHVEDPATAGDQAASNTSEKKKKKKKDKPATNGEAAAEAAAPAAASQQQQQQQQAEAAPEEPVELEDPEKVRFAAGVSNHRPLLSAVTDNGAANPASPRLPCCGREVKVFVVKFAAVLQPPVLIAGIVALVLLLVTMMMMIEVLPPACAVARSRVSCPGIAGQGSNVHSRVYQSNSTHSQFKFKFNCRSRPAWQRPARRPRARRKRCPLPLRWRRQRRAHRSRRSRKIAATSTRCPPADTVDAACCESACIATA